MMGPLRASGRKANGRYRGSARLVPGRGLFGFSQYLSRGSDNSEIDLRPNDTSTKAVDIYQSSILIGTNPYPYRFIPQQLNTTTRLEKCDMTDESSDHTWEFRNVTANLYSINNMLSTGFRCIQHTVERGGVDKEIRQNDAIAVAQKFKLLAHHMFSPSCDIICISRLEGYNSVLSPHRHVRASAKLRLYVFILYGTRRSLLGDGSALS